jgi:hypothetical protein
MRVYIIMPIIVWVCSLSATGASIVGHIADTVTHSPIANVKVTIIGSTTSTTTDAQGNFTLPASAAKNPLKNNGARFKFQPRIRAGMLILEASARPLSVSFVDKAGSSIYRVQGPAAQAPIVVPSLAQGSYLLGVVGKTGTATFRVMRIGSQTMISESEKRQFGRAPILAQRTAVAVFAVTCEHTAYKTREVNLLDSGTNEIRLVPASSTAYYYFPPVQLDDGIQTGSLNEAGMSLSTMSTLGAKLLTKNGYREVHSVLVYKNARLVFEEYLYGNNDTINFENNVTRVSNGMLQWSRTRKHYIASATKAITSTVVGIALDKSGVTVDEKISKYLTAYSSMFTGQKANLTFKHCLTMTSGFDWNEWGGPDLTAMWKSADFTQFVLNHAIRSAPGTEWVYISGLPNVMQRVVQTMVADSGAKFIRENLMAPLGINDYKWETQPGGALPEGAARLFMRPRDMLKWGITCCTGGKWQGKQVIPAAWLSACTQVQANGNYSYYFWIKNYTYGGKNVSQFSAEGDGGNYVCMFPSLNMVVVVTGGLYLESPTYDNQIKDILTNFILPASG